MNSTKSKLVEFDPLTRINSLFSIKNYFKNLKIHVCWDFKCQVYCEINRIEMFIFWPLDVMFMDLLFSNNKIIYLY